MDKNKLSKEDIAKFSEESFARLLELEKNPKWEQFEDTPCEMFSIAIDNRLASKGQIVINVSVKEVQDFLAVDENHCKLSSNVKEFKTIEDLGECKIRYRRHEGSWPVQDRDLVMFSSKKYVGDRLLITSRSIDYQFPAVASVTRAFCHIGGYIVDKTGDKQCKVQYFSDIDLKGNIPGIIQRKVSKSQAEQPAKLKKALEK